MGHAAPTVKGGRTHTRLEGGIDIGAVRILGWTGLGGMQAGQACSAMDGWFGFAFGWGDRRRVLYPPRRSCTMCQATAGPITNAPRNFHLAADTDSLFYLPRFILQLFILFPFALQ